MTGLLNYPYLCLAFCMGFYTLFTFPIPNATLVPVNQSASASVINEPDDPAANELLELEDFIRHRTRELVPASLRATAPAIARAVLKEGKSYNIDPVILMAVIYIESRFNSKAVGRHGEIGLMQVKPSTALWMLSKGVVKNYSQEHSKTSITQALYDPATNIKFGAAYLATMKAFFPESETLYLAAYNMGAGNVQNLIRQGIEPKRYTNLVLSTYATLRRAFAAHQRETRTTASTFDL